MGQLNFGTIPGTYVFADTVENIQYGIDVTELTLSKDEKATFFIYKWARDYSGIVGVAAKSSNGDSGSIYITKYNCGITSGGVDRLTPAQTTCNYRNGYGSLKTVPLDGIICKTDDYINPGNFCNMIFDITPSVDVTIRIFTSTYSSVSLSDIFDAQLSTVISGSMQKFPYIGLNGSIVQPNQYYSIMDCRSGYNTNIGEFPKAEDNWAQLDGNYGIPYTIQCSQYVNRIHVYINGAEPNVIDYLMVKDASIGSCWDLRMLSYTGFNGNSYIYELDISNFEVLNGIKNLGLCLPARSFGHGQINAYTL